MDFLQKLDYLKKLRGDTNVTLAQHSGVPYTTIDGLYKRGYAGVRLSTLLKLSDYFNVSIDYLVKESVTFSHPLGDAMFDDFTFQILHDFDDLDEFGKNAVVAVMRAEQARMEHEADRPGCVKLRHYTSPAAAGDPLLADSDYTYIGYALDSLNGRADYTVDLQGDSMEPDYPDGCTVYVQRPDDIEDGDVVIAWLRGEGAVCKRAIVRGGNVLKLESINRACADYSGAALEDMKIQGKVIGICDQKI